jgi:hypothetical protein
MLDAQGVRHRFLKKRGKHRSLEIQRGASVRRLFLPNSPSDHRSIANCIAMVKRALRKSL